MGMPLEQLRAYFGDLPADLDVAAYDPDKVPEHIAIIMDGNGRWATARGLSRSKGHEAGIEGVRAAIRTASDLGVCYLTIYSFSTENWNRPAFEVADLMGLFAKTMSAEVDGLDAEHVRIVTLGDISRLPKRTREIFDAAVQRTSGNDGMTLAIAVNYGSRQEIVDAAKAIAHEVRQGDLDPDLVDQDLFSKHLYTADMPDPDLLIRTSGEFRISNFLLWQIAYSEIYVTDTYWPDFDRYELLSAILSYQGRHRRFGRV